MKFFKVTLNTVAGDNKNSFFIIPSTDETDEKGNPVYDENYLLTTDEYKAYLKQTKANVISVSYVIYEAEDSIKLNYDEFVKSEKLFREIDKNDYLIDVKKASPKKSGGKRPVALYAVICIAALAVIVLMGLEAKKNSSAEETTTDSSGTETALSAETAPADGSTDTAEATVETSTSPQTTAAETTSDNKLTLTFDKNGGSGTVKEGRYKSGETVSLPYSLSKVGYSLVGWATAKEEPYILYDNEANKYTMPGEPQTLYAVWTPTEYEVIFNYQVGSNPASSKARFKYGELIKLMDIGDTKSDKGEFIGWGLTADATEPVQSLTMPDGGVELYAIYK